MSNTSPAAKKYKRLAVAALASALTFLVVAFLQIPFPIGQGGYINIGDAFIFLFATLRPSAPRWPTWRAAMRSTRPLRCSSRRRWRPASTAAGGAAAHATY